MSIIELTDGIMAKIVKLYPNINVENLREKLSDMQIIETEVGEKSPITFDQNANILRLNPTELANGNYDLSYYMTVFMLLMTKNYDPNLQGLRTGYFAGVASNLVGNFAKETAEDVEPGIDLFEDLRAGVADLSSKVGPDMTSALCESKNLSEFMGLASEIGLENPEQFLAPYNYLAMNSANLTENQVTGLVGDIAKNNIGLSVNTEVKTFN
jgi:hypothetical protein